MCMVKKGHRAERPSPTAWIEAPTERYTIFVQHAQKLATPSAGAADTEVRRGRMFEAARRTLVFFRRHKQSRQRSKHLGSGASSGPTSLESTLKRSWPLAGGRSRVSHPWISRCPAGGSSSPSCQRDVPEAGVVRVTHPGMKVVSPLVGAAAAKRSISGWGLDPNDRARMVPMVWILLN